MHKYRIDLVESYPTEELIKEVYYAIKLFNFLPQMDRTDFYKGVCYYRWVLEQQRITLEDMNRFKEYLIKMLDKIYYIRQHYNSWEKVYPGLIC